MNKIHTELGRGSFSTSVKTTLMGPVWLSLGVLALIAAFGSYSAIEKRTPANTTEPAITEQSKGTQVQPPKPEEPSISKADIAKPANDMSANATQNNPLNETPLPKANLNNQPNASVKQANGNAIQICESESNFFTKNNCRWEQCAKSENKSKSECSQYQRN